MELNVVVNLRIMPTDTEVDFEPIKRELEKIVSKYGRIHKTELKPVAFGLNSLEVLILLNDDRGGMEKIESRINELDGVGSVEVVDINRI